MNHGKTIAIAGNQSTTVDVVQALSATFVVQCGDHGYYVTDWETDDGWLPVPGTVLESRHNTSWEMLADMDEPSEGAPTA